MNQDSFKSPLITTKPILVSTPKIKRNKKRVSFNNITTALQEMFEEERDIMEYELSAMKYINLSLE